MSETHFFNKSVFFMPPGGISSDQTGWPGDFYSIQEPLCTGQIKHRAFAAGFFGFHYMRATLENAPSLRKEALNRLMQMLNGLQIDETFTKNLPIRHIKSLPEFKQRIIKRVSLEVGDYFNSPAQWMVEFGFSLAITYSNLITATQCNASIERKKHLKYIEYKVKNLLFLAKKSEVPKIITDPIASSASILHQQKTRQSARKCIHLISLAVDQLLVTDIAVGVLD